MQTHGSRYRPPRDAGALIRRTALGVVVATAILLLSRAVVVGLGIDLGVPASTGPFAFGPLFGSAVVAGVGAALVYAVLVRFTDRPVENFLVVAAVVFVGSLLPVAFVAPPLGVTMFGQAVLVVFHVIVALSIVAAILA